MTGRGSRQPRPPLFVPAARPVTRPSHPTLKHVPLQLDDLRFLIFGGVDRRSRFNDVWIFDAAAAEGKGAWARAETQGLAPAPRAHCSATRVGDRIYVFGGYGGAGQVHGDLWVLHCGSGGCFRWEDATESLGGIGPSPRFDHAAFALPTSPDSSAPNKLVVIGGRNVDAVLGDSHALDLATLTWEGTLDGGGCVVPPPGGEVCCAAVERVDSVPYHKVCVASLRVRLGMHAPQRSRFNCTVPNTLQVANMHDGLHNLKNLLATRSSALVARGDSWPTSAAWRCWIAALVCGAAHRLTLQAASHRLAGAGTASSGCCCEASCWIGCRPVLGCLAGCWLPGSHF
jgi:hypothetical protein